MEIGYIRVSTHDQHADRQLEGLHLERVFHDKVSGVNMERPGLQECLDFIREGDVLHVHSIDRLARNLQDLLGVLDRLTQKGISIRFHKEGLLFSGEDSPFQRLHLQLIGAVAEFERALTRERQREGIALAKAKGRYKGRAWAFSPERLEEMKRMIASGESITKTAKYFGVSRPTIYNSLRRAGIVISRSRSIEQHPIEEILTEPLLSSEASTSPKITLTGPSRHSGLLFLRKSRRAKA